ncbi:hypothetical protein LCGC14_3128740, partial [marine sediment metagenome]
VYTMKGLMAAYDPASRTWTDLKAKTVIAGKDFPGGPPAYGVGTCYDPVNDEILMFSHWTGAGDPKNIDLRDATGQVGSHLGTLRYRFADNIWRRVTDTFGSAEVKARRKVVIARMARISRELDEAWVGRRGVHTGAGARIAAPAAESRVFATALLESFFSRIESIGTSDGNVQNLDDATDFFPIVKRTPRGFWAGEQVRIVDGFQIGTTAQMAGRLPRGITPGSLTIRDNRYTVTVVGFASGGGDNVGFTPLSGAPDSVVEGVDFSLGIDDDTTAEAIRVALVAKGLTVTRVGAVLTIVSALTALTTNDVTAWTVVIAQVVTDNGAGALIQGGPVGTVNY